MKFTLIVLMISISYRLPAAPIEILTMKEVFHHAKEKIQEHGAQNVLLVFDIDNTLLTANQDFLSYAWGKWQQNLIKNGDPEAITNNLEKFHTMEAVLYSLGSMHTPELFIAKEVQILQKMKTSVIALTSRGTPMRSATEREMRLNKINLKKSQLGNGFPGDYIPKYGKGRPVSFQKGIYMTAGQNKGLMLKGILEKTGRTFKAIIFIDDLLKHTLNVEETFKGSHYDLTTFRYGKMDRQMFQFKNSNKTKVIEQWKNLERVRSEIFK